MVGSTAQNRHGSFPGNLIHRPRADAPAPPTSPPSTSRPPPAGDRRRSTDRSAKRRPPPRNRQLRHSTYVPVPAATAEKPRSAPSSPAPYTSIFLGPRNPAGGSASGTPYPCRRWRSVRPHGVAFLLPVRIGLFCTPLNLSIRPNFRCDLSKGISPPPPVLLCSASVTLR